MSIGDDKDTSGYWSVEGDYVPEEWDEEGYTPNRRPKIEQKTERTSTGIWDRLPSLRPDR